MLKKNRCRNATWSTPSARHEWLRIAAGSGRCQPMSDLPGRRLIPQSSSRYRMNGRSSKPALSLAALNDEKDRRAHDELGKGGLSAAVLRRSAVRERPGSSTDKPSFQVSRLTTLEPGAAAAV